MNLAFPALFIFLLTLPGLLFRIGYRRGPNGAWKHPFVIQSLGDEIAWSLGLAALFHAAAIWAWQHFRGPINLKYPLALLVSSKDGMVESAIERTASGADAVAVYFFLLGFGSYLFGLFAHFLVRSQGLDHRCRLFRYDNPWFYLLSGESLQAILPDQPKSWWSRLCSWWPLGRPRKADVVKISAAVKQGNDVYLYVGKLESFEFDRAGQLDRLVLSQASRRLLSKDRMPEAQNEHDASKDERFYPIETLHFVIRYADICTLNIEHILLREIRQAESVATENGGPARAARSAFHRCRLASWLHRLKIWMRDFF